jgi:putative endonuclease
MGCAVHRLGRRRSAERNGRDAEGAVVDFWRRRGYEILGQRRRTPAGEIDLVVADRDNLVFVEVKARRSFAEAAYAVLPRQQVRLRLAADVLLAENQNWHRESMRFDVALVCGGVIEHIEDAIR